MIFRPLNNCQLESVHLHWVERNEALGPGRIGFSAIDFDVAFFEAHYELLALRANPLDSQRTASLLQFFPDHQRLDGTVFVDRKDNDGGPTVRN